MNLIRNSIYNVIYQLIAILTPIVTLPYVSRVLGEEGIGTQAYTNAIAQYFLLLGVMGLNIYSSRQIAYIRDNKEDMKNQFFQLITLRIITTTFAYIIYILVFVVFNKDNKLIYFIQSLNIIAAMLDISWFFIGIEDVKKNVTRNSIVKIVGVILIFLLVKDKNDIILYTLILSSTQLLGQIVVWVYIPKIVSCKNINLKGITKHVLPSIKLFMPQLAAQMYLLLDKIMLGYFIGETEVGLYDNSQKIIRITMAVVTSIGTVMVPRMSNLYANGKMCEFKEKVYDVFSFMNFISIPMAFGLIAIVYDFKPWFYGDGFNGVETLIIINSFIIIFGVWCNIFGFQILIPLKREKEFTCSVIIGAAVNLTLNIILIKSMKSTGTSIASVIAEFIVPIVQLYYIRNFINIKKLMLSIWKYLISSIIMFILVNLTANLLPARILSTSIEVIIGIVIYILLMLILKDKNIRVICRLVSKKLLKLKIK